MTKSNATFNPSQLTGKIKDNLQDIDKKQSGINSAVVNNANYICQFIIYDEFQIMSGTKFSAEELTNHCKQFADLCLGIPEADYSKADKFSQNKRASLRDSMKIAQVLIGQSLYISDLDETKSKMVSNRGAMMIKNPNTVAGTERFNPHGDEQVRLGKADLLAIFQTIYGNSGNKKTVSTLSKSYADFKASLSGLVITVKETKTIIGGKKLVLPEGVTPENLLGWQSDLNELFKSCNLAHISTMTPEQAVKKGFIDRVDEHPNHRDYLKHA